MKKLMMAVLIGILMVSASNAFAHWKAPAGLVIQDPAPCPLDNRNI